MHSYLIELAKQIKDDLKHLRSLIRQQTVNVSTRQSSNDKPPVIESGTITLNQLDPPNQDADYLTSPEVKADAIIHDLETKLGPSAHIELSKVNIVKAVKENHRFIFVPLELPYTHAFFVVGQKVGSLQIVLNMTHPAYKYLIEVLDDSTEGCSPEDLRSRLYLASDGMKLLLMAGAKFEYDLPDGEVKNFAINTQMSWRLMAKRFLEDFKKRNSDGE